MEKDQSVIDVTQCFEYEYNKQRDLRETSEDNYDFVRGNQWVRYPKQEQKLKDSKIPVFNFNMILPVITSIIGYQITNRFDLKAYGVNSTPQGLADNITRLLQYYMNKKTERQYTHAVLDSLISNLGGYLAIDYTNEDDPFGGFKIRRESPFYHLRDSGNEDYDLNNGSYHLRTKWLTADDLKAAYPDAKEEVDKYTRYAENKGISNVWNEWWQKLSKSKKPTRLEYINEKDNTFRVLEKWDMERVKTDVIMDVATDKIIEIPKKMGIERAMKAVQKRGMERRYQATTINKKTLYVKTVLGGIELIQEKKKYDIQCGKFPFVNIFTYWIDGQGMSNVENLKDYQEEHNKRSVNILQILNSTANSGYWVRQFGDGEIQTDIQNLEVNGANIGMIGTYKGSRPPEKIQANNLPTGHVYLDEKALTGLRATGMIGQNFQGMAETAGESGKLFNQRVRQNMNSMQMFIDNLMFSYTLAAEYMVKAIPQKVKTQRTFDIINEETDSREQVTVNSGYMDDITKGDFEVILTPVDNSDSAKEQEWLEKQAMVSMMPPELVPWHLFIRSSLYRDKEKWAEYIEQIMGGQKQSAQKRETVEDAMKVATVNNLLADSRSKEAASQQ